MEAGAEGHREHEPRDAWRVEAIVLRLNDVAPACDVFPLFYDDIRSCHVVLSGTDPWEGLTSSAAHTRLRIEQELREMKIRMHRAVIDPRGDARVLAGFISRKVKQVRGPLHALMSMQGVACGDQVNEVLSAFGRRSDVDTSALHDVGRDPEGARVGGSLEAQEVVTLARAEAVTLAPDIVTDLKASGFIRSEEDRATWSSTSCSSSSCSSGGGCGSSGCGGGGGCGG